MKRQGKSTRRGKERDLKEDNNEFKEKRLGGDERKDSMWEREEMQFNAMYIMLISDSSEFGIWFVKAIEDEIYRLEIVCFFSRFALCRFCALKCLMPVLLRRISAPTQMNCTHPSHEVDFLFVAGLLVMVAFLRWKTAHLPALICMVCKLSLIFLWKVLCQVWF